MAAFTTAPICLMEFAPVSAMALSMAAFISAVAGAGGEIGFEDGQLFGFFFGQLGAIAFCKLLDGFLALLDEGLQDLNGLGLVEHADFFYLFMLDGGLDAAQDA